MARTVNSMTMTAKAKNEMSGPMRAAANDVAGFAREASTAGKKVGAANKPVATMTKSVSQMPDGLGKSASALALVGSAGSDMGAEVADAANKITALAALMVTGGPLGIAMASITAAIAAATFLWGKYNESTELAKERAVELKVAIDATKVSIREANAQLRESIDATADLGKTTEQVSRQQLTLDLQTRRDRIKALREEFQIANQRREQIRETIDLHGEQNVTISRHAELVGWSTGNLREQAAEIDRWSEQIGIAIDEEKAWTNSIRGQIQELDNRRRKAKEDTVETGKAFAARKDMGNSAAAERRLIFDDELLERETLIAARRDEVVAARTTAAEIVSIEQEKQQRIMEMQTQLDEDRAASRDQEITHAKTTADATADAQQAKGRAILVTTNAILRNAERASRAEEGFNDKLVAGAKEAAKQVIDILAAKAAAFAMEKAIEAWGMPWGGIVGAAAAVAAFALTTAIKSKLQGGGVIEGGHRGRDSVPAWLSVGEQVLSVPERMVARKLLSRLGVAEGIADASGEPSTRIGKQEPTIMINAPVQTGFIPSERDAAVFARENAKATAELVRRNVVQVQMRTQ